MIAFIFPGQGAQYIGMGKDFYDNFSVSRSVFDRANQALNMDMRKLCFEGPDEELAKTENTQPAILTASVAILKALEEEGLKCDISAGLSLGEYTALVMAGVFEFEDAVKLVQRRGLYMQNEVALGTGGMAAILGLDRDRLDECIEEVKDYGIVEAANYNCPGQIVISGEVGAVEEALRRAKEMGAKRSVILPVSVPSHCSLLRGAGDKLEKDLRQLNIKDPTIPVVTNVDAKILSSRDEVIPSLVNQVSRSVLWEDSVGLMIDKGVKTFIEIGPGRSLSSLVKRISKARGTHVDIFNVESVKDLTIVKGGI